MRRRNGRAEVFERVYNPLPTRQSHRAPALLLRTKAAPSTPQGAFAKPESAGVLGFGAQHLGCDCYVVAPLIHTGGTSHFSAPEPIRF